TSQNNYTNATFLLQKEPKKFKHSPELAHQNLMVEKCQPRLEEAWARGSRQWVAAKSGETPEISHKWSRRCERPSRAWAAWRWPEGGCMALSGIGGQLLRAAVIVDSKRRPDLSCSWLGVFHA
ncbi:hypothetical protein TorRG33x02_336990, partial [Trema orientale]